jgi:putative endonuclease
VASRVAGTLAILLHPSHGLFVYIVRCADQSLYIGSTADVEARVAAHNEGRGGSYACRRRPVMLVFQERHETLESADRERQIKRWSRAKKEMLVSGGAMALKRLAISHSSRRFNRS